LTVRGGRALPSYHYRCKNCGYDFSQYQSFDDDPITVCPQCHQEQVRKVFSAVPIEFKGHGFYRTDRSGGKD
jgi:putative FmdB family regulatory protein